MNGIKQLSLSSSPNHKLIYGFLVIFLIAYLTPWVNNLSAGLTIGAYDLAEFTSLDPSAQNPNSPEPVLFTSLLLRLHLVLFTLILASTVQKPLFIRNWWLKSIMLGLLVVAQLPPLEFFINERGNINFQQQTILTAISFIIAIVGMSGILKRFQAIILLLAILVGVLSAYLAIIRTLELMQLYNLSTSVGFGGILLIIGYVVLGGLTLFHVRTQSRN